jgi:hypothetical protein
VGVAALPQALSKKENTTMIEMNKKLNLRIFFSYVVLIFIKKIIPDKT